MHHRLGVGAGDRLLDLACGAGLALELAALRGARCAGIDASPRLLAVARDRSPDADLRVGDMNALPWDDASFDVVTSFRGIWGTTPQAVAEAHRVLVPGGRIGLTVWGHIKASPGAWAFAPFSLAAEAKVQNQAAMVALGRPGAGEAFLSEAGFTEVERVDVPFVFEFADPEAYARALASTGPAFEAIQAVGEESFLDSARDLARQRIREGLPLRAPVALVGLLAVKPVRARLRSGDGVTPEAVPSRSGFLGAPPHSPAAQRLFDEDLEGAGYVTNVSRLWAHLPSALNGLSDLMGETTRAGSLSFDPAGRARDGGCVSPGRLLLLDGMGQKTLRRRRRPRSLPRVIGGGTEGLDDDGPGVGPMGSTGGNEPELHLGRGRSGASRDVGFDDSQIFAITAFVALRLAFSTVNDALGSVPDSELREAMPEPVRSAVVFGRLGRQHEE